MARRKRLVPASLGPETPSDSYEVRDDIPPPEVKSLSGFGSTPPISQVVADTAARAALEELSEALTRARAEGRLVLRLALEDIQADHLVRDRIHLDEEELAGLISSLREHGQRAPIEVTELTGGGYGLISGWRRLTALKRLAAETGEVRFGQILALVRRPETAAAAYVAMVEENEIRLGLSYYERARIAARAVEQGVFESERAALQQLFANASRPRRSKIGSFMTIYHHLDGILCFPEALPERLGLALVKVLEDTDSARLEPFLADLRSTPAPDAASEQARLADFVTALGEESTKTVSHTGNIAPAPSLPTPASAPDVSRAKHIPKPPAGQEIRPGVFLEVTGGFTKPILTLSGPGVDPVFRDRLEVWLATGK